MSCETNRSEEFIELIAQYQPRIFLFILSLVPNRVDAEDLLSETMLVLWQKFGNFRPGSDFRAWAFEVAMRQSKKFWNKCGRCKFRHSDEFLDRVATTAASSSDDHQAKFDALEHCRAKLSPTDQDLLQRRYQSKATLASVAADLGRSEAGCYKAMARIRQALLACIQKTLAQAVHP